MAFSVVLVALALSAEPIDSLLFDDELARKNLPVGPQMCFDSITPAVLETFDWTSTASAAPEQRMVGGAPTTIENFPYIVALTYTYPGPGITVQRCVGCLLSSWHVLTSGYCFTGANVANMMVRAGTTNSLSGGTLVPLDELTIHPDYVGTPRHADLAVITLSFPLPISSAIDVLYLPAQGTQIPDGTETEVVSWGFESVDGPQHELLRTINLNKIGLFECQNIYADQDAVEITETVICANAPGKGMCTGDSGAPMVYGRAVVGISSYVYECGNDDMPDVFTRVDPYTPWIVSVATAPGSDGVPVRTAPVHL